MEHQITEGTNIKMQGFYKIWQVNPLTGERQLLRDNKNLILFGGADLLARAMAGVKYSNISHLYVGYKNHADDNFDKPTNDRAYSFKFSSYSEGNKLGYLRVPLAYSPSFLNQPNYENNIAVFTGIVTPGIESNGAGFLADNPANIEPSQIFEVALVAATEPAGQGGDVVFSRAHFSPLLYNPSYNLTITWGIQFTA
jgi:hypothetical protein